MKQLILSILVLAFVCSTPSCVTKEKPVTKEEALDFAKKLEESISHKDADFFNTIFDAETIKERIKVAANNDLSSKMLAEVPAALEKRKMGGEVIRSMGKDGSYQLVKSYEKEGKRHLIFRLHGDDGLNYHDFELVRQGKEIKVGDMYIYLTGENVSKTLADVFVQLNNYYDNNKGGQNLVESINKIKRFMSMGENDSAISVFNRLPDSLVSQKAFQIMHVQISSKMSNEIYLKAMDDYQKRFPGDPNINMLSLDIHFLHNEFEKALEDVNKIDAFVNKDPFLDYYRGLLYISMNKDTLAQSAFERLYKSMPEFSDGIYQLMNIYGKSKNFAAAKALIDPYKKSNSFTKMKLDLFYLNYPDVEKCVGMKFCTSRH